jgi:hypothetical protein
VTAVNLANWDGVRAAVGDVAGRDVLRYRLRVGGRPVPMLYTVIAERPA